MVRIQSIERHRLPRVPPWQDLHDDSLESRYDPDVDSQQKQGSLRLPQDCHGTSLEIKTLFFARDTCCSHEEEGTFRDGKSIGTEHDKNAAGEQEDDAPSESNPE
jgi:hypothetical protein